jgi:hypothetical protein
MLDCDAILLQYYTVLSLRPFYMTHIDDVNEHEVLFGLFVLQKGAYIRPLGDTWT